MYTYTHKHTLAYILDMDTLLAMYISSNLLQEKVCMLTCIVVYLSTLFYSYYIIYVRM